MTSVTVAGGSFDAPRRVRRAKGFTLSPRHQSWLRYGAGVSIAALLGANAFALTSMLGDAARDLSDRARTTTVPSAEPSTAGAVDGAGFAAFEVPADLDAHYRALAARGAPAGSTGASASGAPAEFAPLPATQPGWAAGPGTAVPPVTNPPGGNGGPGTPHASDPSLVDQVVAAIATVPEVGPAVAPVVADVAAEVEPVVDPTVEAVTEPTPEPVRDAVTETVSALL